jgi:hypothetical protein
MHHSRTSEGGPGPDALGTALLLQAATEWPGEWIAGGGEDISLKRRTTLTHMKIPATHFRQRVSRPQGHSVTGGMWSVQEYINFMRFGTCDPAACGIPPLPTPLPCAPKDCRSLVNTFQLNVYSGQLTTRDHGSVFLYRDHYRAVALLYTEAGS